MGGCFQGEAFMIPAIEVKNIAKSYRLYQKPVDRLKELILRKACHQTFPSLQQVSFVLPQGGILGIVGDNGAGKSTLLKILAGILTPSAGEVKTHGRVAALLELGAGFHPEFTGRQNIHLNATLLGLSDAEIRQKEQAIIDFSELQQSIDRPVKTYSSGMYVRLAFSIATLVDPDILIIDEALSVGDAHFQKKCINRMMEYKNKGKTILFCSHSLYMVQQLCDSALWLEQGQVRMQGDVFPVVDAYMEWIRQREAMESEQPNDSHDLQPVWIKKIRICDAMGTEINQINTGDELYLNIEVDSHKTYVGSIGVALHRSDQVSVFGASTLRDGLPACQFKTGFKARLHLPFVPLLSGQYNFLVVLFDETGLHIHQKQNSDFITVSNHSGEVGLVSLQRTWHWSQ